MSSSLNSFDCYRTLDVNGKSYGYYSLSAAEENGLTGVSRLPYSLKILLENMLRNEDGKLVTEKSIRQLAGSVQGEKHDMAFYPARVLLQDFTGVPAVADLAAMRDAAAEANIPPDQVNPLIPVDLVVDHSVMVDSFGHSKSFRQNIDHEYRRNGERYRFLRWGQSAFQNFRVVPPGTGICHQVNLEYLSEVIRAQGASQDTQVVFPDTVVGADSHTTMVNALAVLGWGVGGIEAEAAMLGQPVSMLMPEVVGFRLINALPEGATATDLVLRVVEILREKGVVGKFVEFFGQGLGSLSVEDRATIANMAPEYGATCGFFAIDSDTINYLKTTNRANDQLALVEEYAKTQGMFRNAETTDPDFADIVELDLGSITPAISGPKRPQDRILLGSASSAMGELLSKETANSEVRVEVADHGYDIGHADVVIAAITSCTNTSNPAVLIAAGLLAKRAVERGLSSKPWVKTSLAPGSQVVTDYLKHAQLQEPLDALGFSLVGYGCTTCIGNSGPLDQAVTDAINEGELNVCSVLSGNRNFEGRINASVKANFIASPPLVVAYAIAGTMLCDLTKDPLGFDPQGEPVYLSDVWPSNDEIKEVMATSVRPELFAHRYSEVFRGDENWQKIEVDESALYPWDAGSTYIRKPPYFSPEFAQKESTNSIESARILALFGDSITTDHISPAGSFSDAVPAGQYLSQRQVPSNEFNSYGSRRGNHELMMRGTFANIRLRNKMTPSLEGGYTVHQPTGEEMTIFDASTRYRSQGVPLVVMAGKEYGTGSSRDWAAKGTVLLGVKCVIAESFERIHRSNLIGMGVLPLVFTDGQSWQDLGVDGSEQITINGIDQIEPGQIISAQITNSDGTAQTVALKTRIDTAEEMSYYQGGGILPYMMQKLAV